MQKGFSSFIKKSGPQSNLAIGTSIVLFEEEDGIYLELQREEGVERPGRKVKTKTEERLTLENLQLDQLTTIADLTDVWLESESKPTFSDEISGVDGQYNKDRKQTMRGNIPSKQKDFSELSLSIGERAIDFRFKNGEEWSSFQIPAAEVIDREQPQDFHNIITLNEFFYDFFSQRFSGEVPEFENLVPNESDAIEKIEHIFNRFGKTARQLRERTRGREPLTMSDEYDVQYLLHALLRLHFDDIRDETYLKRHSGVSPRIDFLVEDEKIGIETKRVQEGRPPKEIRTELAEDKEQYRADSTCETLLCFIYDPESLLSNPAEFEKDLSEATKNLTTRVTVTS